MEHGQNRSSDKNTEVLQRDLNDLDMDTQDVSAERQVLFQT